MLTRVYGLSLDRNRGGIFVSAMMVPKVVVELRTVIKYPVEVSNIRVCNGIWFAFRVMLQC